MYLKRINKIQLQSMVDDLNDTLVIQNEILEHAQIELNKIVNYLNELEDKDKQKRSLV